MPQARQRVLSSLTAVAVVTGLASAALAGPPMAASRSGAPTWGTKLALTRTDLRPLPAPRAPSTADRYAPAGGCFALRSTASGHLVARTATGGVSAGTTGGEPLRFQAFDLGKYLLVGTKGDVLATADNPLPAKEGMEVVRGYVDGSGDERLQAVHDAGDTGLDTAASIVETATAPAVAAVRGDAVHFAAAPSASSEWVLRQVTGGFVLQQPYDDGDPQTPGPVDPPIAATLVASPAGALTAAPGALTGPAARFRLEATRGCAGWAESEVGVSGPVLTGATPYGRTRGYLDGHMHLMAQEFLGGRVECGRVWHPYGVTQALVDCPDHAVAGGRGAVLEDFLAGHNPGTGHDPVGWPTFRYWPNPHSLTHEGVYYKWLERSWRAGQRMMTVLLVENGQLCEVYPLKKYSCDEMTSVRREALRVFELQRYIDAQAGGPGRGWFRVVADPFQARRVVNAGRLAIVLGMEVSRPLGCREYLGSSTCTDAQVDERLQALYDLGVRQMEITNKFDNAFTGVKGDAGTLGVLVNTANDKETGHFWKMTTCQAPFGPVQDDNAQYNVADSSGDQLGRDALFGGILATVGATGLVPLYPAGPQCNAIGMTRQGKVVIGGMMKRGMVFDPDHMSAYGRQAALELLTAAHYSGVISSHSWADDANYYKVLTMGGIVTPYAGGSTGFMRKWEVLRTKADPRFLYGIGWGSDINGFGAQGDPRHPAAGRGVTYPFDGLGGVRVSQVRTGERTWDVNADGVAHYGLYPDWVQDVKVQAGAGGAAFQRDLENGVEAYLQMWERGIGVAGDSCRRDLSRLTAGDLRRVHRGMTPEQVLVALGQPHTRVGTAFTYCTTSGSAAVRFGRDGRAT